MVDTNSNRVELAIRRVAGRLSQRYSHEIYMVAVLKEIADELASLNGVEFPTEGPVK